MRFLFCLFWKPEKQEKVHTTRFRKYRLLLNSKKDFKKESKKDSKKAGKSTHRPFPKVQVITKFQEGR